MANELEARLDPSQTGLTVVARLRPPGGVQLGGDIACPEEVTADGFYTGTMPAVAANVYEVDFVETGAGELIATGVMHWDGTAEIDASSLNADIAALQDISIADVQTALTNQGYTSARAPNLDNLDATISSVNTAIAALNDIDQAGVQAAMTAQGYTTARAVLLDNLDAAVSAVLTAIIGLNDISITDVQTAMTAQGYTSVRALLLDNLTQILIAVEKVRKDNTNRVVINLAETRVDVYEDNGTTIAFSYTISSDKRERTPI